MLIKPPASDCIRSDISGAQPLAYRLYIYIYLGDAHMGSHSEEAHRGEEPSTLLGHTNVCHDVDFVSINTKEKFCQMCHRYRFDPYSTLSYNVLIPLRLAMVRPLDLTIILSQPRDMSVPLCILNLFIVKVQVEWKFGRLIWRSMVMVPQLW